MKLKKFLKKRDISMYKFAEKAKMNASTIYRYMEGQRVPSVINAYKIKKA